MNQHQRLWFEILDKQIGQLKMLGGHDLAVLAKLEKKLSDSE